ncbi:MAG: archease [Spirochaetota bacterium]
MGYEYLDDVSIGDVAFRAFGQTLEELFISACDATINVMVDNLDSISREVLRNIEVASDSVEMLLFNLLGELIYYKDAEQLLLRVYDLQIKGKKEGYSLKATGWGEILDPNKHNLLVDVKAVTLQLFKVEETSGGWKATVILDV